MVHKQRNAAVGRPRFPVELHTQIIGEHIRTATQPLVRLVILCQVCTGWWQLIHEAPELWTQVRSSSEAIDLALERSKNLPLDVRLEDPGRYRGRKCARRYDLITSQKHRWRSVAVETEDKENLRSIFDQAPLTHLKFADIRYTGDMGTTIINASMPRSSLRELCLSAVSVEGWSSMNLRFLEILEIDNIRVDETWATELVEVLFGSPSLGKLHLFGISFTGPESKPFPAPSSHLTISSLKSLSLGRMHLPILLQLVPSFRGPPATVFPP